MAISFCALPLELVFMVLFHGFGLIRVNIRFMVWGWAENKFLAISCLR